MIVCPHCKWIEICPHCGADLVFYNKISCSWYECPNNNCPEFIPEDNTGGEIRYSVEVISK